MRWLIFIFLTLWSLNVSWFSPYLWAQSSKKPSQPAASKDDVNNTPLEPEILNLGVHGDYMKQERFRTIDQINTFIPPLYQPAFVGHGYVLPPGAIRIALRASYIRVDSDDFFKHGSVDFVHEGHHVERTRFDLDIFYGLDHNFTLRVNIPFWSSRSRGFVHPVGVRNVNLFVEGNTLGIGDVTLFLKKKWMDQGNYLFNLATVIGVKFPTGSDAQKFDQPMAMQLPHGAEVVAFNGGPFPRFTDDGRLPMVLQNGTGSFGAVAGLMITRQFQKFRSALHLGVLGRYLPGNPDPGDEVRFFLSWVKPVIGDFLSLDFTLNGMHKEKDHYDGTFTHIVPNPDGTLKMANGKPVLVTTPRPSFRGGTVVFFSPSLIWAQPQYRVLLTVSFRLNHPDLGPWPGVIVQFGTSYTF